MGDKQLLAWSSYDGIARHVVGLTRIEWLQCIGQAFTASIHSQRASGLQAIKRHGLHKIRGYCIIGLITALGNFSHLGVDGSTDFRHFLAYCGNFLDFDFFLTSCFREPVLLTACIRTSGCMSCFFVSCSTFKFQALRVL